MVDFQVAQTYASVDVSKVGRVLFIHISTQEMGCGIGEILYTVSIALTSVLFGQKLRSVSDYNF